ncbi:hypothetical protein D3C81_1664440 [compost metagenome]
MYLNNVRFSPKYMIIKKKAIKPLSTTLKSLIVVARKLDKPEVINSKKHRPATEK